MCLVQNHSIDKFRINEIYEKSKIKMIYDCLGNLDTNNESKTILKEFDNALLENREAEIYLQVIKEVKKGSY